MRTYETPPSYGHAGQNVAMPPAVPNWTTPPRIARFTRHRRTWNGGLFVSICAYDRDSEPFASIELHRYDRPLQRMREFAAVADLCIVLEAYTIGAAA